jgi:hypothetical protein
VVILAERNVTEKERKETKIQEFATDTKNVEYEMYDYAGHKWGHRNSTKEIKRNLDTISGKHSTESLRNAVTLRRT